MSDREPSGWSKFLEEYGIPLYGLGALIIGYLLGTFATAYGMGAFN